MRKGRGRDESAVIAGAFLELDLELDAGGRAEMKPRMLSLNSFSTQLVNTRANANANTSVQSNSIQPNPIYIHVYEILYIYHFSLSLPLSLYLCLLSSYPPPTSTLKLFRGPW